MRDHALRGTAPSSELPRPAACPLHAKPPAYAPCTCNAPPPHACAVSPPNAQGPNPKVQRPKSKAVQSRKPSNAQGLLVWWRAPPRAAWMCSSACVKGQGPVSSVQCPSPTHLTVHHVCASTARTVNPDFIQGAPRTTHTAYPCTPPCAHITYTTPHNPRAHTHTQSPTLTRTCIDTCMYIHTHTSTRAHKPAVRASSSPQPSPHL